MRWSVLRSGKFPPAARSTTRGRRLGRVSAKDQTIASHPTNRSAAALAAAVLVGIAGLTWFVIAVSATVYAPTGSSYPGPATALAEPIGYYLASLAGAVTFGGLLLLVITDRPDKRGIIDAPSFPTHVLLERISAIWAVTAAAMVLVQAASDAGVPVSRFVDLTFFVDAIGASELARAWFVVSVIAVSVAVTLTVSVRWVPHAVLLVPALVGVVAVPVSGNAAQGPDHDYATSAAIVFAVALAVLAGTKITAALSELPNGMRRRVLMCQIACGAVTLGYGAVLVGILGGSHISGSWYGWAGLGCAAVLLGIWIGDVVAWRRATSVGHRVQDLVTSAAMVLVLAAVASMATAPAPALLDHEYSVWDIFLGFELSSPPSAAALVTQWRFDPFLGVGAIALAATYAIGYAQVRRRGDAWPVGRLVAWLAGCLLLLVTSSSGVKAYGSAMFSVHMAEHMSLNMFVPVLLVLGGPITLALRALPAAGAGEPPGPREWLLLLIHSKVTAFLAHPVTAFVLFVGSLYAVYFSPIFDTLVRYHWGHELMSVHFLLVGYLFYWGIIGIDPGPRRLPFLGRLGLLFAVMPFHAFFGIATMSMTTIIGGQFYSYLDIPWVASLESDQHLGGAIAWGSSELPVIIVVIALVAQWARQDRRAALRSDRHSDAAYADDELDAYNAMLRELARNRR